MDIVCVGATYHPNSLIPFFIPKHIFFASNNVIFNTNTHTHSFTLFNKKNPLKIGIQGNNLHIFLWHLKIWILRKKLFRNFKILKLGMPKKWRLNLKQKIKPYFRNTHFLTIFNPKKASCKQIYNLSFNRIMEIYSNVYNYAIYLKLLWR